MMDGHVFEIDVPVRWDWANVDRLSTTVQSCFCAMFENVEGSHAVATVAAELLDNAIRYGSFRSGDPRFRLRVSGSKDKARVIVDNPCAHTRCLEELMSTLRWIGKFPSAKEAYCARLLGVAGSERGEGSGLGLVRAAYESGCALEVVIDGELVSVRASMALVPPAKD
jgi:hypothetical protein